ncbi:creatininase family protein [bacterium]|nr:creatininase family protein [bacterium]
MKNLLIAVLLPGSAALLLAQTPTTREMNLMNWQEFQKLVPGRVETVLLPLGSLEPHGVTPNGTDNLCPTAMAEAIAAELNALIAPTLNYGITPAMAAYGGAVSIPAEAYQPFVSAVISGLADQGFMNIILLNGHGGNTTVLKELMNDLSNRCRVRILLINWWSLAEEETFEVFGENGGHAGNNETAYVQAIAPDHIHPEWYDKDLAIPNAKNSAWAAAPVAASILLYEPGEGYPTFDEKQSAEYFSKVNKKAVALIRTVIAKWDRAGIFR